MNNNILKLKIDNKIQENDEKIKVYKLISSGWAVVTVIGLSSLMEKNTLGATLITSLGCLKLGISLTKVTSIENNTKRLRKKLSLIKN